MVTDRTQWHDKDATYGGSSKDPKKSKDKTGQDRRKASFLRMIIRIFIPMAPHPEMKA